MGKVFVSPSPQAMHGIIAQVDGYRSKTQTRGSHFDIYSPCGVTTPTGYSAQNVLLEFMEEQAIAGLTQEGSTLYRSRFNPSETLAFKDTNVSVPNGNGFTMSHFSKH